MSPKHYVTQEAHSIHINQQFHLSIMSLKKHYVTQEARNIIITQKCHLILMSLKKHAFAYPKSVT